LIANFAPQTEHLPSAVILGCSLTSAPHKPHFTNLSPPHLYEETKYVLLAQNLYMILTRANSLAIIPPSHLTDSNVMHLETTTVGFSARAWILHSDVVLGIS